MGTLLLQLLSVKSSSAGMAASACDCRSEPRDMRPDIRKDSMKKLGIATALPGMMNDAAPAPL